jgi:peptidoglycan/LPS O-acetylase OafA/YrhL
MHRPERTYETLNGLRGVAALVVVMYHYGGPFAIAISSHAILAVDLFFAISGVIMAHVYEQRLRAGLSVGRFMLNRLIRLYPLYMAGTLVLALMSLGPLLGHAASTGRTPAGLAATFAWAALMMPTPGDATAYLYPLNFPAWSLFYELLANLAFAVAAPRLTTRALIWVTGLFAAYLVALGIGGADLASGWTWNGVPVALGRVGFSFTAGLLLYRLHRAPAAWAPRISPVTVMIVTAAMMLAPETLGTGYTLASILFVFPAIVWIGLHNEPGRSARIAAWLGVISYPLYTLHVPLMVAVKTGLYEIFGVATGNAGLAGVLASTMIMAVAGWGADRWYDRPVRRWLTGATRRRDTVGVTP